MNDSRSEFKIIQKKRYTCIGGFVRILLLSIFFLSSLKAEKTDIVILDNGDRITGEVKKLEFGKLTFKTDDMGTVSIEWDKIAQVTAKEHFEVELESGRVYFGSLSASQSEEGLVITSDSTSNDVYRPLVIRITPIKQNIWARMDGTLSIGFNFAQSSSILQFNSDARLTYRGRIWAAETYYNTVNTLQKDKEPAQRNDFSVIGNRYLPNRWIVNSNFSLQQNSELGIDLRLLFGGSAGQNIIQTNQNRLTLLGGMVINQEWKDGGAGSQRTIEGQVGYTFRRFKYDDPKMDLNSDLTVYPDIINWNRVRLEFNFSIAWEIIKDLDLKTTIYESYDSTPPETAAAKNDFGINLTIGWTFL